VKTKKISFNEKVKESQKKVDALMEEVGKIFDDIQKEAELLYSKDEITQDEYRGVTVMGIDLPFSHDGQSFNLFVSSTEYIEDTGWKSSSELC